MMPQQWVNIEDEGAIHVLLGRLAQRIDIRTIDTLWIFPSRRSAGVESTVAVISAFDAAVPGRRRVGAVRWIVTRDRKGRATVDEEVQEYALAPEDALQRVVDGVMRRIGDDAREPPPAIAIGGEPERWDELLRELGAPAAQPAPDGSPLEAAGADTGEPARAGEPEPPDDPGGGTTDLTPAPSPDPGRGEAPVARIGTLRYP